MYICTTRIHIYFIKINMRKISKQQISHSPCSWHGRINIDISWLKWFDDIGFEWSEWKWSHSMVLHPSGSPVRVRKRIPLTHICLPMNRFPMTDIAVSMPWPPWACVERGAKAALSYSEARRRSNSTRIISAVLHALECEGKSHRCRSAYWWAVQFQGRGRLEFVWAERGRAKATPSCSEVGRRSNPARVILIALVRQNGSYHNSKEVYTPCLVSDPQHRNRGPPSW